MKILWWFHLLAIVPSFIVFRKCIDCDIKDKKVPYVLLGLFFADYIPLFFTEILYDNFSQLWSFIGWDFEYAYKGTSWISLNISIFYSQYLSTYVWYFFWLFGIISVLQISFHVIKKIDYYWLSLSGLLSSLALLLYYYSSTPHEYFLYYFIELAIFVIWGIKINYWYTETNAIFCLYNTSMIAGTLLAFKNFFVPEIDLITCIVWVLCAGIVVGVPIMTFIFFVICFAVVFGLLRFAAEDMRTNSNNTDYLHNGKYIWGIFENYFFTYFFMLAMILTAIIFEEIFGGWNRILLELFHFAYAAAIGNMIIYPDSNWVHGENLNLQKNILGTYAQIWGIRILISFFNKIGT